MTTLELKKPPFAATVTERLEADICQLAGNIAAATARFVAMITEYDRRGSWADWGCRSCAHWLSWRCAIGLHAAREKLRVGHALESLSVVRESFARGELSYSQVRAITRIAGPHNEAGLVGIARAATANQLERLVAAIARAEKIRDRGFAAAQLDARSFTKRLDLDTGMTIGRYVLSGEDDTIVAKALESAAEQLHKERGENSPPITREQLLADALVLLAQSFLATGPAARSAGDEHKVITFAEDLLDDDDDPPAPDVVDAPRCHIENGPIVTEATLKRIWCDTAVVRLAVRDGTIVSIKNESRTISGVMRRALRLRDKQCRFPGCTSQRLDAHHIRYRRHGGPTRLANLASLCRFHHRLVHEYGYSIGRGPHGELRFYDSRGRQLPEGTGLSDNARAGDVVTANSAHGVTIDHTTITPRWEGDRLDRHYAVSVLMRPERPTGDAFADTVERR